MKVVIEKKGRPADTLIFQIEIDKKMDLLTKTPKQNDIDTDKTPLIKPKSQQNKNNDNRYVKIKMALKMDSMAKIELSDFESQFLKNMESKYELNRSFDWLSDKQQKTLNLIINKYIS